ncbi:MAG: hypothetical protein KGL25_05915 [Gammaproteobacteria bacterium]|nr:hypothetical protein [Gammaproteobacteria bacterium]MDE2250925.1 hypothetical protein [Gammaproteobacteria bacterium]
MQPVVPNKSWRAVSVVPAGAACEAALQLRGRRFLTNAAPRLPLPECNLQNECRCKYRHLADRRGPPRRQNDSAFGSAPKPVTERRRPGERRERRG